MSDLTALQSAQAAAFAAWKACPASRKADKARLESELAAAGRAVTAAKKAAEPVIDLSAMVAAAVAKQSARDAEMARLAAMTDAIGQWEAAQEWPRCGQNFGQYRGETAAEELMRADQALFLALILLEIVGGYAAVTDEPGTSSLISFTHNR